jgi:hypothetical protein
MTNSDRPTYNGLKFLNLGESAGKVDCERKFFSMAGEGKRGLHSSITVVCTTDIQRQAPRFSSRVDDQVIGWAQDQYWI